MEKDLIVKGKRFHVKYENGIVSVKPHESIAWVSGQAEPIEGLAEEGIIEIARQSISGLGLA